MVTYDGENLKKSKTFEKKRGKRRAQTCNIVIVKVGPLYWIYGYIRIGWHMS